MFQHVPFLKTIWSRGNWSSKRLTWNILYNDKVETVFAINYGTQFSKKNSSIQNGSISIGRSYSKIAFLIFSGSQKGDPAFEPQFCAQKWRNHNLGEEQGKNPSLSISARTPLCKCYGFCSLVKVMAFVLIKGVSPSGISIHPWDFERNAIFTVNLGTKGS